MFLTTDYGRISGSADLYHALSRHPLWAFLGWQDIRQRYRRSVLGPFWLTISTGIQIGTLGFLWSQLFHQDVAEFLPFFAVGLVIWTMLSGAMLESCQGFIQFEAIIRQIRLPFSAFLLRILFRHVVIFAHNALIIAIVLVGFGRIPGWTALLCLPGFVVLTLVTLFLEGPIAIFCTRFRDMPQILANLVNILYYFTPIMWMPGSLGRMRWVYEYNPIYHLFELVRAPLLGQLPTADDYAWALATVVITAGCYLYLIGRFRHRIAYWI